MASACVNMGVVVSPDNFPNISWLHSDLSSPPSDFEFRLHHDSSAMLPADELFFDGKLIPLHFPKKSVGTSLRKDESPPEKDNTNFGEHDTLLSPKAPRCSSRWRELLGLKNKTLSQSPTKTKCVGHFLLHRKSVCSSDASLNLPLLHRSSDSSIDSLSEPTLAISTARRSLSSSSCSSSGHDHDDLPRLSLDEKPRESHRHSSRPRGQMRRAYLQGMGPPQSRGVSMDSPRMNPAGKIVFQSLERSSSSPSSLNGGGGPRYKYKGMERSYSANVRVTRVLNVPVCSLRGSSSKSGGFGLGHLFSQKKDKENSSNNNNSHRRKQSS